MATIFTVQYLASDVRFSEILCIAAFTDRGCTQLGLTAILASFSRNEILEAGLSNLLATVARGGFFRLKSVGLVQRKQTPIGTHATQLGVMSILHHIYALFTRCTGLHCITYVLRGTCMMQYITYVVQAIASLPSSPQQNWLSSEDCFEAGRLARPGWPRQAIFVM